MTLNDLEIHKLGLIHHIDTSDKDVIALFRLGVIPGIEIRKVSSVSTCSEYILENTAGTVVIDKCLADHIIIDELEEESV